MEVSGRRMRSELDLASDEVYHPCQPCQYSGKQTVSKGFCKECEEYMCVQCIKYHKSMKATRGHTIMAVEEDFKPQGQAQSKNWSVNCEVHEDENVKFFCPDHSKLGCNVCMVLEHKTCDVAYIPNVAKDFRASDTCRKFSTQLLKFETDVETLRHTLDKNREKAEAFALQEIENLKRFRDEINALLDEKEIALLDRIKVLKKQNEQILESSKQGLQSIWSEFQTLKKMFDVKEKDSSNLFISYHLQHETLLEMQNNLHSISSESEQLQEYQFDKDAKLLQLLKSPTAFGKIALDGDGTDGNEIEDVDVENLQHEFSLVTHNEAQNEPRYDEAICDVCDKNIVGPCYNCITCIAYDLCQDCFDDNMHAEHGMKQLLHPSVGYGRLLNDNFVHRGIGCDGCDQMPIIGSRHKCKTCFDYDLCDNCMNAGTHLNHDLEEITGFEDIDQTPEEIKPKSKGKAKKLLNVFGFGKKK
ncbi:transcription intermediary factor 1-beta-like isoform X2 [Mya arenaria]|uniref:transcription intermediary factor 1-beta-like isoform X2 n=1 Tax=Mya arenaria TaxID=6604 RepID=UPI0022E10DEC|nr:transcription intermediary factor 1-beta-like isoform X2 [Mya arenaria]